MTQTIGQDWQERSARTAECFASRRRAIAVQFFAKRLMDIVVAGLLLVLLSPLVALACLLVVTTSRGGAFFTAERVGFHGAPFRMRKLRSMYINSAAVLARHGLRERNAGGDFLLHLHDPRITPVGKWLRRTSIDELPQLWHVLTGRMSLVGPRPLPLSMVQTYPQACQTRTLVRPGITGLWQVRARADNVSLFDMLEDDLEYIERFSLWLDLKILVGTLPQVVAGRSWTSTR